MIDIQPTTPADVTYLAAHLRKADERELRTTTQMEPFDALTLSAELSEEVYTVRTVRLPSGALEDPVAIFGVTADPHATGRGVVWLMSTDMRYSTSRDILKEAAKWLDKWCQQFPKGVHNVIDARNLQHLGWCKRMGFKFIGRRVLNGFLFIHAHRECVIQSPSRLLLPQ